MKKYYQNFNTASKLIKKVSDNLSSKTIHENIQDEADDRLKSSIIRGLEDINSARYEEVNVKNFGEELYSKYSGNV